MVVKIVNRLLSKDRIEINRGLRRYFWGVFVCLEWERGDV